MLRNLVNRHYIEKIPPKGANAGGADGKQGEKVLSIQLFSFKKLLFRLLVQRYNFWELKTNYFATDFGGIFVSA